MGVRPFTDAQLTARLNGRPVYRGTIVATAGAPEENLNTSAGTSQTYTLLGGEVILLQGDVDFYYQIENDLTAAMSLLGAKAVLVSGGAPGERIILFGGDKRVMIDSPSGTATVKLLELR